MKQNSSILWLPSIFRAKHQTPWLRKAKDFVWPRALCFLFSFFLFYFETPKESLASSTAQPTQVLQKNWVTGQEKTELNFDTWWIQRAIFTPPAVDVTSVTATSTGSFVVFTGTLQEEQNKLDLPNPHPTRLLTLSTPKYRQHPSGTFKDRFANPCHQSRLIFNSHFFRLVYQPKSLPGRSRINQRSVDNSKNCWGTRTEVLEQQLN